MKIRELSEYLNRVLPSDKIVDSCPNGLQIEGKRVIKKIGTAVSANLETIEKAAEEGVDALIVHHGLFWQRDSYVIQGSKRKRLALLLRHEISLFAYHLPLDLHRDFGNNWKAAQDMRWTKLEPFGIYNGTAIGVRGVVSECSQKDFAKSLEDYYQHPAVMALGGAKKIKTAALISGGAYKSISEAAESGVDAFVTGNFDEPAWSQAYEDGINFYALGHSATERVGPRALAEEIKRSLFDNTVFIDIFNPF